MNEHDKYANSASDALNDHFSLKMPLVFCGNPMWNVLFLGKGEISASVLYTNNDVIARSGMDQRIAHLDS